MLVGFCISFFCFCCHIFLLRSFPKIRKQKLLINIFVTQVPFLFFVLIVVNRHLGDLYTMETIFIVFTTVLSGNLCYVISYPAIQANSPTFLIINALMSAHGKSIPVKSLIFKVDERSLVEDRIGDLVEDNFAKFEDQKLRLKPKGVFLIKFFLIWRAILGEYKGG